jgi:hypothetical protein
MTSMHDDILAAVGCVIALFSQEKAQKRCMVQGVAFEEKRVFTQESNY